MNQQVAPIKKAVPTYSVSRPTASGVRELAVDGTVFARMYMPDPPRELTAGTEGLFVWLGVTLHRDAHVCEPNVVDAIQSLLAEAQVANGHDLEALAVALADSAFPYAQFHNNCSKEPTWRIA